MRWLNMALLLDSYDMNNGILAVLPCRLYVGVVDSQAN